MEELIARMKRAHASAVQQERERFARDEGACLRLIPFGRAHELAFARASANQEEQHHLRSCQHCSSRISAFERAGHPSRGQLLKVILRSVEEIDHESLTAHLASCSSCQSLMHSKTMSLLCGLVKTGKNSIQVIQRLLQAFPEGIQSLPAAELRYASEADTEGGFRALVEHGRFVLRLTQHGSRLAIGLSIDDAHSVYRYVRIDVIGAGHLISIPVALTNREGFWIGGAEADGFDRLLTPNGEIRFAATPFTEQAGE